MKKLIVISIILLSILMIACTAINAGPDGMTFWLETETVQAIHDCPDCSELIDWNTLPKDFHGYVDCGCNHCQSKLEQY